MEPLLGIVSGTESPRRLRIALVYDYSIEHTTGQYVRKALEKHSDVTVYHPKELQKIEKHFDLYLSVDDGSHYIFPKRLKPSALWLIDTHLTLRFDTVMALNFSYIFTAQKLGAQKLLACGFSNVYWLPLACDPATHGRVNAQKIYDIGFVGNLRVDDRFQFLRDIKGRYWNSYIDKATHYDMAGIYSQSRLVLNRSIKNDLNMRVFEGLCSGSLLLTDAVGNIEELFKNDEHLILYRSDEEAFKKIDLILGGAVDEDAIAKNGCEQVRKYHTYDNRVMAILDTVVSIKAKKNSLKLFLSLASKSDMFQRMLLRFYPNLLFMFWLDVPSSKALLLRKLAEVKLKMIAKND
jgi:hypothetical protein